MAFVCRALHQIAALTHVSLVFKFGHKSSCGTAKNHKKLQVCHTLLKYSQIFVSILVGVKFVFVFAMIDVLLHALKGT